MAKRVPGDSGFLDLGCARIDTGRRVRRGYPEAVFCPGKTRQALRTITASFFKSRETLLLTKLDPAAYRWLRASFPTLRYHKEARLGYRVFSPRKPQGLVAVVTGGTADIAVAEEAATTLSVMGNRVRRLYDVGVAGVHRLFSSLDVLRQARVIVVVAGMEGALASVVSGLVSCAVVAVPTSCGYGAHFGGIAPLLTMLNSCSPGVAVVNIDNGFGAGYLASLINNPRERVAVKD